MEYSDFGEIDARIAEARRMTLDDFREKRDAGFFETRARKARSEETRSDDDLELKAQALALKMKMEGE